MNSESSEKDQKIIKLIERMVQVLVEISEKFYRLNKLDADKKFRCEFHEIGYKISKLALLFNDIKTSLKNN